MDLLMPNWYEAAHLTSARRSMAGTCHPRRIEHESAILRHDAGTRARWAHSGRLVELGSVSPTSKRIQLPTLVISGKYDTMDPAYMAQMAKQLPHGELAATNGGHMAMYDDQPTILPS
jgi:pimeloyl-ACP methyl ester carboxylesterase